MTISKTLAAALAVAAIAAPAAVAQPADMHASTAIAAAKAQHRQDLRSPDAIDAARNQVQDLRSPDAADTTVFRRRAPITTGAPGAPGATVVDSQSKETPVAPGQPTWAVDPKPIAPPAAPATATSDDGVDWTTIGLGIAGTLLVLGGLVALTSRLRTTPRTGVSV